MALSKADQEAEAARRASSDINPADNAAALDVIDDGARVDPGVIRTDPPAPPADNSKPPEPPPSVSKREEIIARFRQTRAAEEVEGNPAGFERSGMPLLPGDEPAEPPAAEPEPGAPLAPDEPAPRFKVKVHGEERELSLDDIIAEAQKSLAAGNILDQAKALRNEMQELVKGVKTNSPQPGHQAEQRQPAEPAPSTETPSPDQDDRVTKLIETIQFGDPTEARDLLQNTIAAMVQQAVVPAVKQSEQTNRLKDEGARTAKVVADFQKDHPEIAADARAVAAVEYTVFELQRQDLIDLGVDPAQIQTPDGRPVSPADIAMAHRWYRSEGYNLKAPKQILEEARDKYLEWRGQTKPNPTPAAQTGGKEPPVVEITIDRTQRRAAIPQQPSRSGSPPSANPAPAPQPRDEADQRSSVVQQMAALRGKPRFKVGLG
jgi:hypothetical protein